MTTTIAAVGRSLGNLIGLAISVARIRNNGVSFLMLESRNGSTVDCCLLTDVQVISALLDSAVSEKLQLTDGTRLMIRL